MLTSLAPEGHVLNAGVFSQREKGLAAIGATIPELVFDCLSHVPSSLAKVCDIKISYHAKHVVHRNRKGGNWLFIKRYKMIFRAQDASRAMLLLYAMLYLVTIL